MPSATPINRRTEQKETTRRLLRDVALACFVERGFAATSIADITAAAGVAKGTFYVHYDGKEALLDEHLSEFNASFARELVHAVGEAGRGSLESIVTEVARRFVAHFVANRAFVRVYAERSTYGLDVAAFPFGINPEMRSVLGPVLAARFPSMSAVEVDLVVHGLLAIFLRLGLQAVFRDDLDPNDVVRVLVTMTTGVLASYEPTPRGNP